MRGHRTLSRWLENLFPIPQHSGPVIVRVAFGHRMLVEPRRGGLERSLFYTGAYETGTLHIISKILHEGDTFVDVGANIGLMSVRASELVSPRGRVFAFEPVPQTFTMLEYNLRLNDCSNASAYNVAVGIARETLAIYEADTLSRGSASLFHPNEPAVESSVQVDTLDHLLDASQSITALKIDVEGWEPAVLKGATRLLSRHDAPMLIVEYTDDRRAGQDGTFQARALQDDPQCEQLQALRARSRKRESVTSPRSQSRTPVATGRQSVLFSPHPFRQARRRTVQPRMKPVNPLLTTAGTRRSWTSRTEREETPASATNLLGFERPAARRISGGRPEHPRS